MADILTRKETAFVLWHAALSQPPPELIIGWLQPGTPLSLIGEQRLALRPVAGFSDLWELPAGECNLMDGWVYYYWFAVAGGACVTDPFATAVDWRCLSPQGYPAAAVKFTAGRLVAADVGGETPSFLGEPLPDALPPNNRLVIYELPTAWARPGAGGGREVGVGSFRDVIALIEANAGGATFDDLDVTRPGRSYLAEELGVNALELLPAADSVYNREWGYGTTNYFAPDFELGFPAPYSWPAPNRDLAELVGVCHLHRMRFIADMVMAFSKSNPYLGIARDDFFILNPQATPLDPDALNSRPADDEGQRHFRDGFGATLFRYAHFVDAYDPVSGQRRILSPAGQFMKTVLDRWIADFHIDGVRMDSIENIANWDFVREFKDHARLRNAERYAALGLSGSADERFIVVGEELSEPQELLTENRLDGLWHQSFKDYIRMALLGLSHENEASLEATVRRAIDCRAFGYEDLAQAIIYLTSHDVEGFRNERLCNFFLSSGVTDIERRTKLAFACLLTAVGIPMILAGEEFADQHDLLDAQGHVTQNAGKQVDPVNFTRLADDWRSRIKTYVSRLIQLRTSYEALSLNDVSFIHTDFEDGKRVLAWRRGRAGSNSQVVVLANFSDFATPNANDPGAAYVVPSWPEAPPGLRWREVPQTRWAQNAGREPLFAWEAKVYALF